MARAQYSPLARVDIDAAAAFIAESNLDAARRFLQALQGTVNRLVEFPELGALYPHPNQPRLRAKLVTGFKNYIVFYAFRSDRIYVVRVLHAARDIPRALER